LDVFRISVSFNTKAIFLLCLPAFAFAQVRTIDVKQYGAVGDGKTDDRPAIQAAMNAAVSSGVPAVYFGPGTYYLGSSTSQYGQLAVSSWSAPIRLDLIGNQATLQTQQDGTAILFAEGYWQNSTIQGLTFENTHPVNAAKTGAILFAGGGQNAIRNWTITGNTFRNFSRHISVSGVTGLNITNNIFLMMNGRDSGTGLGKEPNVGIWLFDNSPDGNSVNIQISGNRYNGCVSGDVSGSVTHECGDGLVLGTGSGIVVENNVVEGFSYEGIYMLREPAGSVPPIIRNNSLNGAVVKGDKNGGGQWAIRCDADGALITNNTVTNALNGIYIYGVDLPTDVQNSVISNNTVVTTAGNTQAVATGIGVVAASNITVTGNTVSFASQPSTNGEVSLMVVNGMVNRFSSGVSVTNNTLTSSMSGVASSGMFIQFTAGWNISGNTIQGTGSGFHLMNLSGPASVIQTLNGQNTVNNAGESVTVTNGYFH
jgi:hypothetical protein